MVRSDFVNFALQDFVVQSSVQLGENGESNGEGVAVVGERDIDLLRVQGVGFTW